MKIIEITKFTLMEYQAARKLVSQLVSYPLELTEEYFREILASDNSHLFFLYDEENVAGMLTVGTYKTPTGSKAWIEDVVIDEKYRGKGLGKMITQHAIDFAKSQEIELLMLTSSPARIAANKLYQELNFERKETNVYRMKL